MKFRPFTFGTLCLLIAVSAGQSTAGVEEAVRRARTQAIHPRSAPPKWMDYDKVMAGYAFFGKHGDFAGQIMGTSSLAATFAARDITPMLMATGRLPKDFQQRMGETGQWMNSMFDPPRDRADFVKREYIRAVELGQLHADVAKRVGGELKWNPKERAPMNGQAFSFVLYTFAWWPVEAMIATHQIDPIRDAKEVDAWFHLWRVFGYGMGAPESLLPKDFAQAQEIVALLRREQYVPAGAPIPEGVPVLLRGHVRMVAAQIARQAKLTPEQAIPSAAKTLAGVFALSPGQNDALGLGPDPVARLTEYAALPAPK